MEPYITPNFTPRMAPSVSGIMPGFQLGEPAQGLARVSSENREEQENSTGSADFGMGEDPSASQPRPALPALRPSSPAGGPHTHFSVAGSQVACQVYSQPGGGGGMYASDPEVRVRIEHNIHTPIYQHCYCLRVALPCLSDAATDCTHIAHTAPPVARMTWCSRAP
jgi:hypothetical protein